jgi:hypothetical protein
MNIKVKFKNNISLTSFERNLKFSYGDIVKINSIRNSLSYKSVTNLFGIDNPKCKEIDDLCPYPTLSEVSNKEWKVIDFCANYDFTIDVLLKNRLNQYLILEFNKISGTSDKIITVIRKSKKENKNTIILISKT